MFEIGVRVLPRGGANENISSAFVRRGALRGALEARQRGQKIVHRVWTGRRQGLQREDQFRTQYQHHSHRPQNQRIQQVHYR